MSVFFHNTKYTFCPIYILRTFKQSENIVSNISKVEFHDAKPRVEYTMNILWTNRLNEISQQEEEDKKKWIPVSCSEANGM